MIAYGKGFWTVAAVYIVGSILKDLDFGEPRKYDH